MISSYNLQTQRDHVKRKALVGTHGYPWEEEIASILLVEWEQMELGAGRFRWGWGWKETTGSGDIYGIVCKKMLSEVFKTIFGWVIPIMLFSKCHSLYFCSSTSINLLVVTSWCQAFMLGYLSWNSLTCGTYSKHHVGVEL